MAAFSSIRTTWQVKRLDSPPADFPPRGGSSICSTEVGLLIFGGASRDQVAFDDLVLCTKVPAKLNTNLEATTNSQEECKKQCKLEWKKIETEGDVPQPRSGHATVSYKNYLFLFGGIDFAEETAFNDLYVLNLSTWTWKYVGETGAEIEARNSHSLAILHSKTTDSSRYHPTGTSCEGADDISGSSSSSSSGGRNITEAYLVVFGGASVEKGPLGDTFYAPLPQQIEEVEEEGFHVHWTELKSSEKSACPSAREMHSTCCNFRPGDITSDNCMGLSSSLFIAGGRGLEVILDDVWELSTVPNVLEGGTSLTPPGAPFQWYQRQDLTLSSGRCAHGSAILDAGNGSMLLSLVGGFTGSSIADDIACVAVESGCGDATQNTKPTQTNWLSTRCGSAIGARFGAAVCAAPKWLLNFKFPDHTPSNVENGGLLLYGGVNAEKDFGDVLLLLPPTR